MTGLTINFRFRSLSGWSSLEDDAVGRHSPSKQLLSRVRRIQLYLSIYGDAHITLQSSTLEKLRPAGKLLITLFDTQMGNM
jgi:hypothetical protein